MDTRLQDLEKLKEVLIAECDAAVSENTSLKLRQREADETISLLQKKIHTLGRETKRLSALNALLDFPFHASDTDVAKALIDVLYRGVQAPEKTCTRVYLQSSEETSEPFIETQWRLAVDITAQNAAIGMIELFYVEFDSTLADSGFVFEERAFIETVSRSFSKIMNARSCAPSSADPKTLLAHHSFEVERETQRIKKEIVTNIDAVVLPLLRRLKSQNEKMPYFDLLEGTLQDLASSFGRKISPALTSREVEICNMIRNGLTGKEIAELLNISFGTVEVHRNNIRKKLKLVNQTVSLSSYLKNL